jgi:hypothetical protein
MTPNANMHSSKTLLKTLQKHCQMVFSSLLKTPGTEKNLGRTPDKAPWGEV